MSRRQQARHAAAMRFFNSVRNKNDLEHCVAVLAPEDIRAEFQVAFRRFSQSMDMLLPDPRALEYGGDLGWLGKIGSGPVCGRGDLSEEIRAYERH